MHERCCLGSEPVGQAVVVCEAACRRSLQPGDVVAHAFGDRDAHSEVRFAVHDATDVDVGVGLGGVQEATPDISGDGELLAHVGAVLVHDCIFPELRMFSAPASGSEVLADSLSPLQQSHWCHRRLLAVDSQSKLSPQRTNAKS